MAYEEFELAVENQTSIRIITSFGSGPDDAAAVYGSLGEMPFVRVHSKCGFSTIFGSKECDCGWQLQRSREILSTNYGLLIHLDQEGRGAGLTVKAQAYQLTHLENLDTYEAYQRLGVPTDSRNYDAAVGLVQNLGVRSIRLLTNNPDKLAAFASAGIDVRRIPLVSMPTPTTAAYLAAKKRHGHLL